MSDHLQVGQVGQVGGAAAGWAFGQDLTCWSMIFNFPQSGKSTLGALQARQRVALGRIANNGWQAGVDSAGRAMFYNARTEAKEGGRGGSLVDLIQGLGFRGTSRLPLAASSVSADPPYWASTGLQELARRARRTRLCYHRRVIGSYLG